MIEIRNLTAGYGKTPVLRDLSLSLDEGKIYALIGPSGCGKSTLLKVLCGIRPYEGGEILIGGQPWRNSNATVGYVPQNYGLLDWKTVGQNIFLPLELAGKKVSGKAMSGKGADALPKGAWEIIESLGLGELLHRYPAEISGGQKQRTALARAFVSRPQILLMDEPFSALDAFTSVTSQRLFLSIWERFRVTTLFITHNTHEAAAVGQHVLLMDKHSRTIVGHLENTAFGREDEAASLGMALAISKQFAGVVE